MADLVPLSPTRLPSRSRAITPREVAYIMFRRRWVILAVLVPVLLVAAFTLLRTGGSVVAASRVLLELRGPEAPIWNTAQAVDYDRSLSTYKSMAMSVPVAEKAAEALRDSIGAIRRLDPKLAPTLSSREDLAGFLLDNLDVQQVAESSILEIRFKSANPRLSLMADRACRDAFIEYSVYATKNSRASDYYMEQLKESRADIDSLLEVRSRVLLAAGYGSISDDQRLNAGLVAELESNYNEATTDRRTLEARVIAQKAALAANPDYVPPADTRYSDRAIMDAKYRLEQHRDTLNKLMAAYAPESVEVQRQREVLASAQQALTNAVSDYIHGFEVEVIAARAREQSLQDNWERAKRGQRQAPEVYSQVTLIDTDLEAKRQLLKDLQVKAGEVRLNAMADERISRIIKLTEPDIDRDLSKSKEFAYFGLVGFFGLLFSLVVAFVVDQSDHRIYSPRSLEDHLDVPVLGAVTASRPGRKS